MPGAESDQYFPVARDMIAADVATGIDLYLEVAGNYVLYRSGLQPLDAQAMGKLLRHEVDVLYVPCEQSEAFHRYVAEHAAALIEQADTREQQVSILRTATEQAVREALRRVDDPASYERVRKVADVTVQTIAKDVELMSGLVKFVENDRRLLTHTLNVTSYAIALGVRDGLDHRMLHALGTGAMLHDIGVSAADEEIMGKRNPLTEMERDLVARHPRRGREILESAGIDDPLVLDIALQHHGRSNKAPISRAAQIVQIADSFDALTNVVHDHGPTGPFAALYHMRFRSNDRYPSELLRDFVMLLGSVRVFDANSPIAPLSRWTARKVLLAS